MSYGRWRFPSCDASARHQNYLPNLGAGEKGRLVLTRFGCLRHYVADLELRGCAEDGAEALRALEACCAETVATVGLFAVADEVDGSFCGCEGEKRESAEKGWELHRGFWI